MVRTIQTIREEALRRIVTTSIWATAYSHHFHQISNHLKKTLIIKVTQLLRRDPPELLETSAKIKIRLKLPVKLCSLTKILAVAWLHQIPTSLQFSKCILTISNYMTRVGICDRAGSMVMTDLLGLQAWLRSRKKTTFRRTRHLIFIQMD